MQRLINAMKKILDYGQTFAVLILILGLAACSNPADDVSEAEVSTAKEISEGSIAGKKYVSNADSKIGFTGSKVTGSHDGGFETFTAAIHVENGEPVPNGTKVEIDMDSTWSDSDRLTGHLKNADFFDAPTYPTSTFVTTDIKKGTTGYDVTGNLTLHGETKSITFPADIQVSDDQVKVAAEFFIKRYDFGIQYPGKANDLIRDEVVIRLDITAVPE